jgi:hypothetical protein
VACGPSVETGVSAPSYSGGFAVWLGVLDAGCGCFLSLGALTPEPPGVTSDHGSDCGGSRFTERLAERFLGGDRTFKSGRRDVGVPGGIPRVGTPAGM